MLTRGSIRQGAGVQLQKTRMKIFFFKVNTISQKKVVIPFVLIFIGYLISSFNTAYFCIIKHYYKLYNKLYYEPDPFPSAVIPDPM